jgi:nitrate reductase NapAB chaperone NapD
MTICSLVIQAIPEQLTTVSQLLDGMEGVEVHAQDKYGKLIISIDHPSRRYCSEAMTDMTRIEGVMSTSLVFEYQEDLEPNPTSSPSAQSISTEQ